MLSMISDLFLLLFVVNRLIPTETAVLPNNQEKKTCGYESCAKVDPTKLNIHIVAHSHDDVGWLKTVDQYYFGHRNDIQIAGVQYIINSAVKSLQENPERRFIYVETAFLWKWWLRQDEKEKAAVRSLIDEGRLEIIGGGWSMNDEAVTHYHSIIDQFTWGFRRLNDTFGKCGRPKIGWQIDPFGHSREQASMFAQMGFDGLLFGRLDYQDKSQRMKTQTPELIWKGSPSLGESSNLFTTVLYNIYVPPSGFCFDILCSDEPLIDDTEVPDYNIDRKVEQFLEFVNNQAKAYRTNNVIITMGNDFTYQNADTWFTNLDKLIRYTNQRNGSTHHAIYSTPSCYLKAVNDRNVSWTTKSDDFFPYASDPHSYWTGYYTSRPTIKLYERMGNNFLQVVKQLSVLSSAPDNEQLEKFREAMGILQHHDAVTGTEKQHVANDYSRILTNSISDGENISTESLRNLLPKETNSEQKNSLKFHSCLLLNISTCEYTENNKNFIVTLYNPTSRPLTTHIRLPVTGTSYLVRDYLGTELVTQIVPISTAVKNIPGRKSSALHELLFLAIEIPALGYQSFYVSEKNQTSQLQSDEPVSDQKSRSMGGNAYDISVDTTGKIVIQSKLEYSIKLTQSFHYYEGAEGNNHGSINRTSGAYIFRPNVTAGIKDFNYNGYLKICKGPLVEELQLTVNKWISQVVRVYSEEERIEFSWVVGPIDINDGIGKEIITKYTTDLNSNGEFSTDSNGREMLKRERNKRQTWNLELAEPIAGNYYPVTTKISLSDEDRKLKMAVLTDRAQGGSSLKDGEIELMLHRRLLKDDAFGVGEALNETAYGTGLVAKGEHSLFIGNQSSAFLLREKNEALRLALRPWIFITPLENTSYDDWKKTYKMQSSGVAKTLPPNIHILTLEPWKDGSILLRLEHLFESDESVEFSKPVTINIQELFSAFTVTSVHETTLGGNQWLKDNERLRWVADKADIVGNNHTVLPITSESVNGMDILLMPMQIRTFIVNKVQKPF
ncbi:lysosomal alpha-mannosidase-like [Belonocnema kinseyi]|uniref:lysosomal alpha-mannosidase-like n=1 Tax=Belonocnema kinseyi TaxID=2817044 RepID=UPI00143DD49E|nr:lysosomal alpha-mannosidase-like [Belonocnema kinseyi]